MRGLAMEVQAPGAAGTLPPTAPLRIGGLWRSDHTCQAAMRSPSAASLTS